MILKLFQFLINKYKRKVRYFMDYCKLVHQISKKGGYIGSYTILKNCEYVKIGNGVRINEQVRIECYPNYLGIKLNPDFVIEDNTIIGPNFTAFVADSIVIHEGCIFAGNVTLISENHGTSPKTEYYQLEPLQTGPIEIGKGCWLGQNVSVLPNTNIGERCIIATNSVVRGSIPPYSMVAGIPARVIKKYNQITNSWESI